LSSYEFVDAVLLEELTYLFQTLAEGLTVHVQDSIGDETRIVSVRYFTMASESHWRKWCRGVITGIGCKIWMARE